VRPHCSERATRNSPWAAARTGAGWPPGAAASGALAGRARPKLCATIPPHSAQDRDADACGLTNANQLQAINSTPAQAFGPLAAHRSFCPNGAPQPSACRLHLRVRHQARTTIRSPRSDHRPGSGHKERRAAAARTRAGWPPGAAAAAALRPAGLRATPAPRCPPRHRCIPNSMPACLTDGKSAAGHHAGARTNLRSLSAHGRCRPHGARLGPACRLHLRVRPQARRTPSRPSSVPFRERPQGTHHQRQREPGRGGLRVPPTRRSGQQGWSSAAPSTPTVQRGIPIAMPAALYLPIH
jgi:hypothetical protein